MVSRRGQLGLIAAGAGALLVALSPAIGAVAPELSLRGAPVSLRSLGSIASFTPVTQDRRLAQAYARAASSAQAHGFRFTPTSGSMSGRRSITVVVRADQGGTTVAPPSLGIAPVAYNLGSARGLRHFADPESVGRRELDPVETIVAPDTGFRLEARRKFSTNVRVAAPTEGATSPSMAAEKGYSLDVASSYALTRNLNVVAGVRYKGTNNRLGPITDDAQDSQAIYVGTAFRF